MEITQEHKAQIEEIISAMQCPKDFECYKSDFRNLCRTKVFRGGSLCECLDPKSWLCKYSFSFGNGYFCKCTLRKYIATNLNL
jgi:hypothetical protein